MAAFAVGALVAKKMSEGGGKKSKPQTSGQYNPPSMMSFQDGTDFVPETGPAMLHQGEAVVPAAQNPQAGGNPSGLPPEMQKALMAQLQRVGGGGGQPGMMQPPQGGPPQMPQFQNTSRGAMLPTGSAVPTPRGIQPSAAVRQPSQVPSQFPKIIGAVYQAKQAISQNKVQKARQLTNAWIAMSQAGANDPALKQQADQMMADPKTHKIFDKAMLDPNSPEAQGVQMAYQDQMQKDRQQQDFQHRQAQMQQMQALMMQEMARAQQARSFASLSDTRAEQAGQVTPAMQFQEQQKNNRVAQTIGARLSQAGKAIAAMRERAQMRITSMEKIAGMRESGANKRAGIRTQQNQALNAKLKQYKNIQSEIANVEKESKELEDVAKNPMSWVTGDAEDAQGKMAAVEAKRAGLEQRLQALDDEIDQMSTGGVIPQAPAAGGGSGVITITPEMMRGK